MWGHSPFISISTIYAELVFKDYFKSENMQIHCAHILVKTEEEVAEVARELKNGHKF